ncbi:hypothetical protein [uncultured Tateyamaria sp.]|uniref:cupredoxin domain-containing protein n=1 Tax=uncultured Tateyamaria sp. TaxID=455651 RepID=UPI00261EAAE8|nr:hypothetical protein [uncultured Tateyamaria sp.]
MKRMITLVATVATLTTATTAVGEVHDVMILDGEFFPQVTYLNEGDSVRFENVSGITHTIGSAGDEWATDPIEADDVVIVVFDEDKPREFYSKLITDDDGDLIIAGMVDFSPPSAEDDND